MASLKDLAKLALSQFLLPPGSRRHIFVYHDVADEKSEQYSPLFSTQPTIFLRQLDFLQKYFRLVSLDKITQFRSTDDARPLAAITFDDGFRSVHDLVWPLLSKRSIPFAAFVNEKAMRENTLDYDLEYEGLHRHYQDRVFMNEEEVVFLHRQGVLIGSHARSHQVLSRCDAATLEQEIAANRHYLQTLLGSAVNHFAVPYGKKRHFNSAVLEACLAAGHTAIYSANPTGFAAKHFDPAHPVFPRIGVVDQEAADLRFLINRPRLTRIDI